MKVMFDGKTVYIELNDTCFFAIDVPEGHSFHDLNLRYSEGKGYVNPEIKQLDI